MTKKKFKTLLSFTAILLALLMLSFPVTALSGINDSASSAAPPDTTGGYYEEFTDPIPSDDEISTGVIGGGQIELQDYTVVTSSVVPDGVYAIENIGNADRWMGVQQNLLGNGANMQQYGFGTSPADTFTRAGLFKISKSSVTGYYIIRFMMNNLLTFDFDGNSVKTKLIAADDTKVPASDQFAIEKHASGGYTIRPIGNNTTYVVAANNTTASGAAGAPQSYLIKSTVASSGAQARWELQKYTGSAQSGMTASANPGMGDGITVGSTSYITVYAWSTVIGSNHAIIQDADAGSDRIDLEQTSQASGGNNVIFELTAKKVSRFTLYYRVKNATTGAITATYSSTYFVTPDLAAGTYYIQNGATGRYMDIEGPSMEEGEYIQQWSFSTALQKQWTFVSAGGGYYTIKSNYSNKYVGIDPNAISQIKQYSAVNDYTKWYFEGTESGRYALHNKVRGATMALSSAADSSENGSNLLMLTYSNDSSYRDEWVMCPIVARVTISISADEAYRARYTDYVTRIADAMNTIQEKYLLDFGIFLYYPAVLQFSSYGDECDNNAYGSSCECISDAFCLNSDVKSHSITRRYHHKNIYNILARIEHPDLSENISLVLIGHNICYDDGNHVEVYTANGVAGVVGVAFPEIGLASVFNFVSSAEERMTMMHEIGHLFGAPDHYGGNAPSTVQMNQSTSGSSFDSNCIYGENRRRQEVLDSLSICEGCKERINNNRNRYNHNS